MRISIAVLLTSYNRVGKTLSCLASLESQEAVDDISVDVYLADANSSDGTATAVVDAFPRTNVVPASSSTYWAEGMYLAGCAAAQYDYDFHLWLNDDVKLDSTALRRLVDTVQDTPESQVGIAVGQLRDSVGRPSYGGLIADRRIPLRTKPLGFVTKPTYCDTFNGNVVLVSKRVLQEFPVVDGRFSHAMGDVDYGLRARKAGLRAIQISGSVGTCDRNVVLPQPHGARAALERLRVTTSTKNLPPSSWWRMCRRHGGRYAIVLFVKPYVSALIGRLAIRLEIDA